MNHIFKDPMISQKIGLKGLGSNLTGHQVFGYLNLPGFGEEQSWTLAEWSSRHLMKDGYSVEPYGEGGYRFFNEGKNVIWFPGKNEIRLEPLTSHEYERTRKGGEGWIHLLLEQKVEEADRVRLADMKHLYVTLEYSVDYCEMKMPVEEYDTNCHAAQVSWYFTLENCIDPSRDFEGRPDYLWFGLPMFDNRSDSRGEGTFFDWGTQKLIFGMDKSTYIDGPFEVGKSYRFSFDVLPVMRHAYDVGRAGGVLVNTNWEDLAIGSTNIGWEVPGTFDCSLTLKDLDVTYELK